MLTNYILKFMPTVWEVRHGSVMALREILTHQGGCAGVLMSDSTCDDGVLLTESDDKMTSTVKREREIDLNMQIITDETEPELKKLKSEEASFTQMHNVGSTSADVDVDMSEGVANTGCNLSVGQTNGEIVVSSVKVEPQSCMDSKVVPQLCMDSTVEPQSFMDSECYPPTEAVDMSRTTNYFDNKDLVQKVDILEGLPQNSELVSLIKRARNSSVKNSELLQDCGIRFLCVLSLDRYNYLLIFLPFELII